MKPVRGVPLILPYNHYIYKYGKYKLLYKVIPYPETAHIIKTNNDNTSALF